VSISASDSPLEPISCTFDVVNLDERPSFAALSYVWGNDPPTSFILHPLRRHPRSSHSLWVDAVCINQADMDEKATQIPLMGDIYSGAESVYVWLG
ncbi:HET-domain-containing protein, partial [Setomelanomma holmii]